jgi:hypothetical protein
MPRRAETAGEPVNETAPDWLLGTWRLVSVLREDLQTGVKADFFGPDPIGYITYSADRRMMVVIVRSRGRRAMEKPGQLRRHFLDQRQRDHTPRRGVVERELDRHAPDAAFPAGRRPPHARDAALARSGRRRHERAQHGVGAPGLIRAIPPCRSRKGAAYSSGGSVRSQAMIAPISASVMCLK